MTAKHARSFYFSSFALPPEKKTAAYAVYAFCRHADDLVDFAANQAEATAAIERVGAAFDRILAGEAKELEFAPAFAWAVRRYEIPREHFLDLVRGVSMDLGPVRIKTWEELYEYCYYVASVVGLMMCRIFELSDPQQEARAIELGLAMQLTNILRDIREDLDRDRIYLPEEELARFGVDETALREGRVDDAFVRMMQFQIERARRYYTSSELGIRALADDGSQYTVWLMRMVYAGILDGIESQKYDVFFARASTGLLRKLSLAWEARRRHRASRET